MEGKYDGTERRENQWYTNKELFEKFSESISELDEKLSKTNKELGRTNTRFHEYNGLHDRFDVVDGLLGDMDDRLDKQIKRCDQNLHAKAGKNDLVADLLRMWPIIITTVMAAYTIWRTQSG